MIKDGILVGLLIPSDVRVEIYKPTQRLSNLFRHKLIQEIRFPLIQQFLCVLDIAARGFGNPGREQNSAQNRGRLRGPTRVVG